jgi:acetyl esterase
MSTLDPEAQDLLDVVNAAGLPPLQTLSVDAARERMRVALVSKADPLPIDHVEDVLLPTASGHLSMRLYRPTRGQLPVALFLHGGGWTVNDLDTHDYLCRYLASRSGCVFASLDFRRAPEHKHPAALEDAYFAYRWLLDNAEHLDLQSTYRAIVGESSGGTTAAGLTLLLRDAGAPLPSFQVLAYPLVDHLDRWPSYDDCGIGYTLDRELIKWFCTQYLGTSYDQEDPYMFPLRTADLSGLPPTLVMTAEFDPLRDEGSAYAQELSKAGVPVEHIHARGQMHGFLLVARAVRSARALVDHLADALASHCRAATGHRLDQKP